MRKNSNNISINNNRGFSLLEITVVLIIISILLSAVIPVLSRQYLEKAAQRTAQDISAIEDASRKYYIDNNTWPSSVAVLQSSSNYLPSGWSATNPFIKYAAGYITDFAYHISPSPNGSSLTVSSNVPPESQAIIENLLPTSWNDATGTGYNVYSTILVPGDTNALLPGTIVAYPGTTPGGYLACDGSVYLDSNYPNLAAALGPNFATDATHFAVPDIQGRTIVGVNTMTKPVAGYTNNRIWSSDSYSIYQDGVASTLPYNVNTIGSVFGEEGHRQTLQELVPHSHTYLAPPPQVHGFSGESTTAPRGDDYNTSTSSTGGNGDPSGLGAPSNVVAPSVTMNYIIKT